MMPMQTLPAPIPDADVLMEIIVRLELPLLDGNTAQSAGQQGIFKPDPGPGFKPDPDGSSQPSNEWIVGQKRPRLDS
ncbi:hypothetical protein WJX84_009463 [Apatococcus fuscideae]|uniref:Uncharacterized protein n=1 Tax=Apatococcus fuscideae TaxID=2026836 RepID=A0AAW1SIQ3_9CHLO